MDAIFRTLRNEQHGHLFSMWLDDIHQHGASNAPKVHEGIEELLVSQLRQPTPAPNQTIHLEGKHEPSQLQTSEVEVRDEIEARVHADAVVRDVEAVSQASSCSGATIGDNLCSLEVEIGSDVIYLFVLKQLEYRKKRHLKDLIKKHSKFIGFYPTITRARFEELNMDPFKKCMELMEKCLRDAKMDKSSTHDYGRFVKPAFDDFVLPSKKYADVIIPHGGDNHVAIDLIVQHIRTKLGQHDLCKIYPNVFVIQSTFQIRGMHTLIRDREITTPDFVFYSDRVIRLVVEHGLGHLPFTEKQVVTPTGSVYMGVDFCKKLCGVSIVRRLFFIGCSGESMENALRACCKGIKIGKILIHRVGDDGKQLIYEKLPKDISERHVLLLDPVLGTGNSANHAIDLLIQKGVPENRIIFLNLISVSAPEGIHCVCKRFPSVKIVTSEIDAALNEEFRVIPGLGEFGDRYFGTDN
ncbi:hypothetical protein ZIOFF_054735 [Zingiber officinale]|uniref:Phosphoribosyltransferase domain-containing protein n=1 Tax=Zingiber officinale TaxID=94328 RepID=A0A8J5FFD7_ZINOF|nr:hypothetical protein ZIOFF_054735 [Zingiber officinale]